MDISSFTLEELVTEIKERMGGVRSICPICHVQQKNLKERFDDVLHKFSILGVSQQGIRDIYGSTEGQKLWSLCLINRNHPQLKIIKKLIEDPSKYSALRVKLLHAMTKLQDPSAIEEEIFS